MWSCSSCGNWGENGDTSKDCRECQVNHQMKLADAISCYAFTRDIRTMSVKEAIALGKIKPPKKIKL